MYTLKLKRNFIERIFKKSKRIENIEEKTIFQYIDEAEQIINKLYENSSDKYEELYTTIISNEVKEEEFNKKIENLRKTVKESTGRTLTDSEIIKILNIDEKNRTITKIDEYLSKIDIIMNHLKVVRRNSDKPMMTPRSKIFFGTGKSEAHLTTRGIHQEQVEKLAAEFARYLGLNEEFTRIGARHHDDGHTSSGHTGERIASLIGYLYNCAYIVHNALSADIPISEDVFAKVIEMIKREEGELTPEREQEIKDSLWKILDIAISHNGEGKERVIYYNPNKTTQQIIDDKNRCYTEPGYDKKIVPGSKEAALVVFADRISYVRTDILDGVNLGILTGFDENYLKYIGLLAAKYEKNEKFVKVAQKVFQTEENLKNEINNLLDDNGSVNFEELNQEQINAKIKLLSGEKKKALTEKIQEYKENEEIVNLVYEAATKYGTAYVSKIPIEKRAETVADMIKEMTAEDLKEYSKGKDYVGLSPMVAKAFFGIRSQNLYQIVKYTRRKYERELLPEAEYRVHKDLKNALIDTGIVRQYLEYKEKNDYQETTDKENEARKKLALTDKELNLRNHATTMNLDEKANTKLKEIVEKIRKCRFERKVCHKFMKMHKNQPERLEEIYNNSIKAVENITKEDVEMAVRSIRNKEKIELKKDSDILTEQRIKKIEDVIKDMTEVYPDGFTDEDIKEYTEKLIEKRKEDKVNLFASAFALEYVSGMADTTLLEASLLKKYMKVRQLKKGNERGAKTEEAVERMGKQWNSDADKISILEKVLNNSNKER